MPLSPDIWNTAVRSAAMLAVVLGLLIAVLYLMKRFMRVRSSENRECVVKSLAAHYFSPRERIEVVDIEGVRIVVGITARGISYLTTLPRVKKTEFHASDTQTN